MNRTLVGASLGWLGISMIADGVPALLVPYQVAASGRDAAELGLVTLLAIGLAAVAQPFAGAWSDRVGRRPAIGLGLLIATSGLALILDPAALLPGTVLALVGASIVQAGYQGVLPDRVPSAFRGRGAGAKGFFDVGGAFLAFALLAGLLAADKAVLSAVVLAVGLALPIVLALLLLPGGWQRARSTGDEGWGRLRAHAGLTQLIVARFCFLLGIYAVGRFLLLFIADRQGLAADAAATEAGIVLAVLTLVTAAAALPAGWLADRVGRRPLMVAGALVAAAGIGLLPLGASAPAILAFGGLMAIGAAAFGAGSWAMLADLSAGADAGRLLGIGNFGTAGAAAAAGLFGPLIDTANAASTGSGYTVAFIVAAAFAGLGALLAWRLAAIPTPAPPVFEVPN